MIQLAEYTSYRSYLKDVLAQQKASHRDVTLSSFAKAVGLSTSGLQMILDGSRNLTVHKIHEVAAGLRMNERDHALFETLVLFEQAESPKERRYYQARLRTTRTENAVKTARVSDRDLLADWYLPAFLIFLVDRAEEDGEGRLRFDYEVIRKELGLSREKVDQLIESLRRRGVLRIKRHERVHIVFDKVAGDLSKKRYLLKVLEEMRGRMDRGFTDLSNYFQGHTFSMNAADLEAFITEYKALLDRYIAKGDTGEGDPKIFQTLFCLSTVL